jgi:uncharacterized membrane protein
MTVLSTLASLSNQFPNCSPENGVPGGSGPSKAWEPSSSLCSVATALAAATSLSANALVASRRRDCRAAALETSTALARPGSDGLAAAVGSPCMVEVCFSTPKVCWQ